MEAPALVFIGFMGAGKTTGARAAAAALGVRAIDTDRELEQRLGTSIEDYFASHGERAFREVEEDVVAEVLEAPPAPVISIGGGAIGSARVRELLARHTVVMLDVDEATAWRRAGGKRRPLARDRERFAALHAERAPLYEALADAVLLDGGAETVRRAAGALRKIPTGAKVLWAVAGELNYPVYVGDVLDGSFWPVRGRRFLISDSSVDALYGDQIPDAACRLAMPPGEAAKTLTDGRDAAARARGRRDGPRRPRRGARRGRGRRRRGLLRRGLPARRRRRAGADDARRPGRLGLRRQDRGGPARGQELRRRLPPAARGAGRSRARWRRSRPRSSRPAGPR